MKNSKVYFLAVMIAASSTLVLGMQPKVRCRRPVKRGIPVIVDPLYIQGLEIKCVVPESSSNPEGSSNRWTWTGNAILDIPGCIPQSMTISRSVKSFTVKTLDLQGRVEKKEFDNNEYGEDSLRNLREVRVFGGNTIPVKIKGNRVNVPLRALILVCPQPLPQKSVEQQQEDVEPGCCGLLADLFIGRSRRAEKED